MIITVFDTKTIINGCGFLLKAIFVINNSKYTDNETCFLLKSVNLSIRFRSYTPHTQFQIKKLSKKTSAHVEYIRQLVIIS